MNGTEGAFERLMLVFVDADGVLRWPLDDVQHLLPWCLLHMPLDADALDDNTVQIFSDACAKAGVPAGTEGEAIVPYFDAWYATHPPNPELALALAQAWRETTAAGSEAAQSQNPFAKFSGSAGGTGVLGGGTRPEGTVPGGALGRMALQTPPKKKK